MRPTFCLCLIVKNEIDTIERCIESCRELIDYWVICDTGSTDGTQDKIRELLVGIPGDLYEDEWVDFGHNRTLMSRRARDTADYALILDADIAIEYDIEALHDEIWSEAPAYLVEIIGDFSYWTQRVVDASLDWHWEGATHEYIVADPDVNNERRKLDAIKFHHYEDGGSRDGKTLRDLELLHKDWKAKNAADPRTAFYLAQSYADMGKYERALAFYEKRLEMGGWDEEMFITQLRVGKIHKQLGHWALALEAMLLAQQMRPMRMEARYELSLLLRERELWTAAWQWSRPVYAGKPNDILFLDNWIYDWGLMFEHSINCYWMGNVRESERLCMELLEKDLPENFRDATLRNYQLCRDVLDGTT